ncbi:MAG: M23 family metallopeptidase [Oscillospiraceae bacterium]|nr:M23 family metallopeptidase [Oscillospiraceae bacterium]
MRKTLNIIFYTLCALLIAMTLILSLNLRANVAVSANQGSSGDYIKWVDFNIPYRALEAALAYDIKANQEGLDICWIDMLAYLSTRYGNKWNRYKPKDMAELYERLAGGETIELMTADMSYFGYYHEAYTAVLGNMVGIYYIGNGPPDSDGNPTIEEKYGLKSYLPVAYGYSFSHFDDFGNSRNFGFRRKHLGNDLIGRVGTPIMAVESGTVQNIGWNRYGGWRIGIRSLDKKRYYYYAHLRKGHPFAPGIEEGSLVQAGDVIGYMGMTGYSDKEDTNGMTVPHLHFGMQLIFHESQEEGGQEIWIDVYQIVKLLQKHGSPVVKTQDGKDYVRKYEFRDPALSLLSSSAYNMV